MDKVDDFISKITLIEREETVLHKYTVIVLVGAVMYGIGMWGGMYVKSAQITDEINVTERRIMDKMQVKPATPDPKIPLSI